MKKLFSSFPFILGILLGTFAMYSSIFGKLHTTADAEIFIFSIGFAIAIVSFYATFKTIAEKA